MSPTCSRCPQLFPDLPNMFRRSSTFSVVSTFSDFPTNFRSYRAPRAQQCQRALHFDSFLFWSLADDCYFLGLPHSVLSISSSPHIAKVFKSKLVLFVYAFSWSFFLRFICNDSNTTPALRRLESRKYRQYRHPCLQNYGNCEA